MEETGVRILVVDDERAIRRFLRASLSAHGHTILEAAAGREALSAVAEQRPDIIFLDLGLPDMDGVEVTRQIREWSDTPIIILSVRDREADKIAALEAGADDYLVKPFGMGELMVRMRAVLRRVWQAHRQEAVFQSGELKVDYTRRRVWVGEREVNLTPTEYDLLKLLAQNAGKVLTHPHMIQKIWGSDLIGADHLLRVNISNLRKKLEADPARPQYILTEAAVGYRLRLE
ncbi:response regulator [Levilinea saccharolytica]|uniref:Fis family transcriptional regulator n=1 Tax=Levilinea saccharolytica TaxID=229921 RepID=A0A0M8JQG1_9CHLR|nr:response regulator transcription factor [Levilinea saccharolytica]KPL82230.1 Fis family transcriptional regulator [Levilinea saccharolytica]GAP19452.1 response regulator consisting of a CheY-like receiver domain and a winged-helix DNA-binding domain [Levilinea saccharolytica]